MKITILRVECKKCSRVYKVKTFYNTATSVRKKFENEGGYICSRCICNN